MTAERTENVWQAAASVEQAANRFQDGIDNVLEPEVKDARMSALEARSTMVALARRVTYLFLASILINTLTVAYVLIALAT